MFKSLSAIVIAASLIAGPALAQGQMTAPASTEAQIAVPAPKAKVAVHQTRKHVAQPVVKKQLVKKHLAKKHVVKKHLVKKHLAKKTVKHVKTVKRIDLNGKAKIKAKSAI